MNIDKKIQYSMVVFCLLTVIWSINAFAIEQNDGGKADTKITVIQNSRNTEQAAKSGERIGVELWIMSQCPFGVHAVLTMETVMPFLRAHVDLKVGFILTEKEDKSGFESMHGESEVTLDKVFACADYLYPEQIIDFMAETFSFNENWRKAAEKLGMSANDILACLDKTRGEELLAENAVKSKKGNISASPTLMINGKQYVGGMSASDLFQKICGALNSEFRPDICSAVPEELLTASPFELNKACGKQDAEKKEAEISGEEIKVTHTIIYEPAALALNFNTIINKAFQIYPKGRIELLNGASEKGAEQLTKHGIIHLPALLISRNIEKIAVPEKLKKIMSRSKTGTHYIVNSYYSGANRDISRVLVPGRIEVFYDPVDSNALDLLLGLERVLKMEKYKGIAGRIKITPFIPVDEKGHFIAENITSIQELLRQYTVLEFWPDSFFKYVNFLREDIQTREWEKNAARAGLNRSSLKNNKLLQAMKRKAEADIYNIMDAGIRSNISIRMLLENRELITPVQENDFIRIFDLLEAKSNSKPVG